MYVRASERVGGMSKPQAVAVAKSHPCQTCGKVLFVNSAMCISCHEHSLKALRKQPEPPSVTAAITATNNTSTATTATAAAAVAHPQSTVLTVCKRCVKPYVPDVKSNSAYNNEVCKSCLALLMRCPGYGRKQGTCEELVEANVWLCSGCMWVWRQQREQSAYRRSQRHSNKPVPTHCAMKHCYRKVAPNAPYGSIFCSVCYRKVDNGLVLSRDFF